MSQDQNMRARSDGKARVRSLTVWTIEVGPLALRCVATEGPYLLQSRDGGRWRTYRSDSDPLALLRSVANSRSVENWLSVRVSA